MQPEEERQSLLKDGSGGHRRVSKSRICEAGSLKGRQHLAASSYRRPTTHLDCVCSLQRGHSLSATARHALSSGGMDHAGICSRRSSSSILEAATHTTTTRHLYYHSVVSLIPCFLAIQNSPTRPLATVPYCLALVARIPLVPLAVRPRSAPLAFPNSPRRASLACPNPIPSLPMARLAT